MFQGVKVVVRAGTRHAEYVAWMRGQLEKTIQGAELEVVAADDAAVSVFLYSQHLAKGWRAMLDLENEVHELVGRAWDSNPHAVSAFGEPL